MEQDDNKWCVYKHTSPNGKCYIGISHNIKKRWSAKGLHYKQCILFWNAIQKYGWDNFQHDIIFENISHEDACEKERDFIQYYKSINMSYNILEGGEGAIKYGSDNSFYGKHHSEETKKKISESNKGKTAWNKGIPMSEEQKKKLSESRKGDKSWNYGKKMPENVREALMKANKGIPMSEEQKRKISKTLTGRKLSEDRIEKQRQWMIKNNPFRGKKHTEETRKKMSEKRKGKVSFYRENGPHNYFVYCDENNFEVNKETCAEFGIKWISVRRAVLKQSYQNFDCVKKYLKKKNENKDKSTK